MTDDGGSGSAASKPDMATAGPTKTFFVDMLTRDIDLGAAILDLLDNCVDGIRRSHQEGADPYCPYEGFRADIVVGAEQFSISDNCGGIPIRIARESAFAIGRPSGRHEVAGTVGMYGVGMKRAIFKFGRRSVVSSFNDMPLRVEITPEWLDDPAWDDLPIAHPPEEVIPKGTTRIVVTSLRPEVAAEFDVDAFRDELTTRIAEGFTLILRKGFSVTVREFENDPIPDSIAPRRFALIGPPADVDPKGVVPYVYAGKLGEVEVELYAGLYRPLLSEEEIDDEEWAPATAEDSGWIVACNDRIVVWKDRTRLTGWGEANVPNWHGQFLGFVGIVMLHADDPDVLPLTTTKQGIDASSEVWSLTKDMMRETTKAFTNLTNKWKAVSSERAAVFRDREEIELYELRERSWPMKPWPKDLKVERFAPTLPIPMVAKTEARVSFAAPRGQVTKLAIEYFDDATVKAGSVGLEAFRREYDKLQKAAE